MDWSSDGNGFDPGGFLIYLITVKAPRKEFRYVGKSRKPDRFSRAYQRNIDRAKKGEPKRPRTKRNGEPQREGNLKYRYIHLVLLAAVQEGWPIEHIAIREVATEDEHAPAEREEMIAHKVNANDGPSWFIEDAPRLLQELIESVT